ncbi:hypothetical protein DY000_02030260 [Brassica cretica]|uniref:Uncharacterized protein n=1 Tax=Brassica cretica TaxID=69181 RepID=A0ABQ7DQV8_BRACR|nr:hypothetical protein DY000_02030260 [Brassica cretica]
MTRKKTGLTGRGLFGSGFKAARPSLTAGRPIEPHLEASSIPLLSSPENDVLQRGETPAPNLVSCPRLSIAGATKTERGRQPARNIKRRSRHLERRRQPPRNIKKRSRHLERRLGARWRTRAEAERPDGSDLTNPLPDHCLV